MKALSQKLAAGVALVAATGIVYAAPIDIQVAAPTTVGSGLVTVNASVDQTLRMNISADTLELGNLGASYSGATLDIEVGTNAKDGLTVVADSANGGLSSATSSHVLSASGGLSAESYQIIAAAVGADDLALGGTPTFGPTHEVTPTNKSALAIYSSDKPEYYNAATADIRVTVQAKADASTPAASDYTDGIVFTVTGKF